MKASMGRCVPIVAPLTTKLEMNLKHESVSIEKSIPWTMPKVDFYTLGQATSHTVVRLRAFRAMPSP
ncbi:hypothetical protein BHE74_00032032 [Ensete ventricosum]|nr:hypothetical protein BHE74_00032032 [Ensete ventricosum]RZS19556.1 hypothetical protein BHM03_00051968 [Ensete ventricosum]